MFFTIAFTIYTFVPKLKKPTVFYPKWYSNELKTLLKNKQFFHKKYKRTGNKFFYEQFSSKRIASHKLLRLDYNKYIQNVQESFKTNPKQFWEYIRTKKGNSTIPNVMSYNGETISSQNGVVECFQQHFSSVFHTPVEISNIISNYSTTEQYSNLPIVDVKTITEEDVLLAIKKIKSNMCAGLDKVPAFLIKDAKYIFVKPLLQIFNKCLSQCTFPELWKQSRICPIFKGNNTNDVSNYRPIAILSNFAKIFESVLYSHIYPLVENLISDNQHGYMSKKSTCTNLMCVSKYLFKSGYVESV